MNLDNVRMDMYEKFKGLPANAPIVRNNQINDAYVLASFKILYGHALNLDFEPSQVAELAKYVVAPPDGGIDIFIEDPDDEESFDVIQVKNCHMNYSEVREAFAKMKETVNNFCNDPTSVKSISCREILSASNLSKSNKKNCHYYVIHTGRGEFNNLESNETVLNEKYLSDIYYNGGNKVKSGSFFINNDNFMYYDVSNKDHNAVIVSLNCYDLAVLNNKFYKAKIGSNILYGQNLRDGLGPDKNKAFENIKNTIITCPELFWYYNNGMAIIADKYSIDTENVDGHKLNLKGFSIVNGAQTTSALGHLLKVFTMNKEYEKIESLKRGHVLAKVIIMNDVEYKRNVAIYNNNQNSILNRDIVANRPEQLYLQKHLAYNPTASIYMEIRRGAKRPDNVAKGYKHRITKNETLGQIAFAAFEIEPFTAKDKKSALFSFNYAKPEYTINEYYHKLFNLDNNNHENNGILLKKSIEEIDEALFSLYLYSEGGKVKRRELRENITEYKKLMETADNAKRLQDNIDADSSVLETIGSCKFYCISTYYLFKERFDILVGKKVFDYENFYSDKEFRDNLIKDYVNLFMMSAIRVLIQNAKDNNKSGNIANWLRGKSCQDAFISSMKNELTLNSYLKENYITFVSKYKL